jgi:membrane-bound serine protease (ClpP class)
MIFPGHRSLLSSLSLLFALSGSLTMLYGRPLPAHAESFLMLATYDGVITPVSAEYFHDALVSAEERGADALIFRLNTPGGLDSSMRLIIKDITAATVPIVVYVSPSSARAASAGVFITMAAHIAAMAPGTNIGAAHPIAMGGTDLDSTMKEKVENDSVAYIKTIAEQRGRNIAWAEDAVRKSLSVTAGEALKLNIIDLVAQDLPTLLTQLNGRSVLLATGPRVLHTVGASLHEFPLSLRLEFLKTISDPNIAYLLMTLGTVGLIAELYNPGAILPGIVGAISLILAFYSLQSLPVNYAGILLFMLGVVFLILEAMVTSFGMLALGGIIAMLLGSVMLVKTDVEFLQISWWVILPVVALTSGVTFFMVGMGIKAMRRPAATGREELVGMVGVVKTPLAPQGYVAVRGELWQAISGVPLQPGEKAEVTGINGLRLSVKPVSQKGV